MKRVLTFDQGPDAMAAFAETLRKVNEGESAGVIVVFSPEGAYSKWSNVAYISFLRALSVLEADVAHTLISECVWWRRASLRLALFARALWVW